MQHPWLLLLLLVLVLLLLVLLRLLLLRLLLLRLLLLRLLLLRPPHLSAMSFMSRSAKGCQPLPAEACTWASTPSRARLRVVMGVVVGSKVVRLGSKW
jgi:hypothetical protein